MEPGPLIAISCVRDEQDIVEGFVRHTLALADRLVVIDNGSTDGTPAILAALAAEGLPLEVVPDPSLGCWQRERMTRLMRDAVERLGAAWVLPLDADELLAAPDRAGLRALLAGVDGPIEVPFVSYVPCDRDDPAEANPLLRLRHRLAAEQRWSKVLVPRRVAAQPGAALQQGNHAVEVSGQVCPAHPVPPLHLAHFPVRSVEQLAGKVAKGHLQVVAMSVRESGWNSHYREPYRQLLAGWDGFAARAPESMARLVAAPGADGRLPLVEGPAPYMGGPLRHTPPVQSGAGAVLSSLLSYTEQLAAGYAGRCREVAALTAEREHLLAGAARLAELEAREARRERRPLRRARRALRALWRRARA